MSALPPKFEESIKRQLGDEFQGFLASLQQPPPVSIRTHPIKTNKPMVKQPVPWAEFGYYLGSRPSFTLDPLFHAGSYYVQEASSMFLEQALKQTVDLNRPIAVLDLCAAPGGKSTHILSLLNRDSLLVSNEAIRTRASILSENIQKWGYPNAVVTNNDPSDFRRLKGFFDVMVIDAPCSGEGLFRKDPHAISEWSPEDVHLCSGRQKRIVSDAWDALRENGILIYCTCTFNASENEDNLKWLRENHSVEFLGLSVDPEWNVKEVNAEGIKGYRFFPHRVQGEGFYLCVIRKTETTGETRIRTKHSIAAPPKQIQERLSEWTLDLGQNSFYQFDDLVFYTPSSISEEIQFLLQTLKIMYAGTNVATVKHDKLIPEHALALSVEVNKNNFLLCEVSETEALKYLRKECILLEGAPVGFTLLTYHNLPIGWANVLSNRVNNMYPSDWRIRMKS